MQKDFNLQKKKPKKVEEVLKNVQEKMEFFCKKIMNAKNDEKDPDFRVERRDYDLLTESQIKENKDCGYELNEHEVKVQEEARKRQDILDQRSKDFKRPIDALRALASKHDRAYFVLSSEVFVHLDDPTKYEPRIVLHSVF